MQKKNSGATILFVLVIAVILNLLIGAVVFSSRYTIKLSGQKRERISALNIAEAGKEHFYAKLIYENFIPAANSDIIIYDNVPFTTGFYTVRCSTGTNIDIMSVWSYGKERETTVNIKVVVTKQRKLQLNTITNRIPAAITARSYVELIGNVDVDGRDYDSLNNLVGSGKYGAYTCCIVNVNGNSVIGGNGLAPVGNGVFNSNSTIRHTVSSENVAIIPEFNSPEAFLGLSEGSLDDYKVAPGDFAVPFKGLIYVTGSIQNPVHFGESRGILIVHNSAKTAKIATNKGNFKGLIICDVMDKINGNAEIIGAIVTLSTSTSSTFGNGNADVHYSKQVLDNLSNYCENVPWKIKELSWQELLP